MMKWVWLGMALCSAVATAAPATKMVTMTAAARRIIQPRMLDPTSLQVRGTRVVAVTVNGSQRTILCGEYNSKNRFGGYVGFKTFVYEPTDLGGVLTLNDGFKVDFFSDGRGRDFDSDVETSIRNGADASVVVADSKRAFDMAKLYFPACLAG